MSGGKSPRREERRRQPGEINLLVDQPKRGFWGRTRRGCSIPFFGSGLLGLLIMLSQHT